MDRSVYLTFGPLVLPLAAMMTGSKRERTKNTKSLKRVKRKSKIKERKGGKEKKSQPPRRKHIARYKRVEYTISLPDVEHTQPMRADAQNVKRRPQFVRSLLLLLVKVTPLFFFSLSFFFSFIFQLVSIACAREFVRLERKKERGDWIQVS